MTSIEIHHQTPDNLNKINMFSQQHVVATISDKDSLRFSPSKKSSDKLNIDNVSPTDTVLTLNLSEHSSPVSSAENSPTVQSSENEADSSSSIKPLSVDGNLSSVKRFSDGNSRNSSPVKPQTDVVNTNVTETKTAEVVPGAIESSSSVVACAASTFIRPQLIKTDSNKSARSLALLFNVDDSDSDAFAEKILGSSRKERESFDNINSHSGTKFGQQPVTIIGSSSRISCSVQQRKQSDAPRMIPQQLLPKSTSAHSLIDPAVTQRQIKVNELRKIITPLYQQHNPNKLIVVDSLIFNYCDGKEYSLFLQLEEKYTLSVDELQLFDAYLKKYDKQCGSASSEGISQTPRSVVSPRAAIGSSSSSSRGGDADRAVLQRVVSNKPVIPSLPFNKLHPNSPGYIASSGGSDGNSKSSNKTVGKGDAVTPAVSVTDSNKVTAVDSFTTSASKSNKSTEKKKRAKCIIC